MQRRAFLAALPATALMVPFAAKAAATAYPGVRMGDRVAGADFAGRSAVWGSHGAAATAHPFATLIAIDILRQGGSAVDAAIAANAALGFLEPTANGIGGDCFVMLWDPAKKTVVGLNGSGRSPRGLSLAEQRRRAVSGHIARYGAVSVSVPGAVDAWWELHRRYGKLAWRDILTPAANLAEQGAPVPQTIAFYLDGNMKRFADPGPYRIEETSNARKVYTPEGRTPREGEVFRNPDLARTLRTIAEGGRDAFYDGPIADHIEAYFKRIGGWMTRRDLSAHHAEWVQPIVTDYRGTSVWGLPPNSQGLSTLQILNIMEQFDLRAMGFQSAASIHHQAEAKRLAFEDRARWFADPAFSKTPIEHLNSKDYARERARLIQPDRVMDRVMPGDAPHHGDTTYFTTADKDGMMVSIIQSNYRGMGSGLVPDGPDGRTLGFMFQDRGELYALSDGHPNLYAPGKRPFQTIIPGFATRGDAPLLSFGVMGGDMQPQGQAQIIANMVDYGLGVQEAGDAPRWHHEGSSEPTGEPQEGTGTLRLETGVPAETRDTLAGMGWKIGATDGGFGGYQAILKGEQAYGAASEMRKDGLALAY
ncbi:MAG: gamma-glutamyltransferase [Caulobacteraceae bacterium]|nr:gamma-glutamyltransferase [Caulobacteraceae bacterium]